jgi:hypothetical protein
VLCEIPQSTAASLRLGGVPKTSGAVITIAINNCSETQAENFKATVEALTPPVGVTLSVKLEYQSRS